MFVPSAKLVLGVEELLGVKDLDALASKQSL
jgi:hypothetical protein